MWFGLWEFCLIILKLLFRKCLSGQKQLGPKVRQHMRFVVEEVEEFESFKFIKIMAPFGRK